MKEQIIEIITISAPLIAGVITSVIIPIVVKVQSLKHLKSKIDEISEPKQLKDIKEELELVHKEILEMRGKRK